MATEDRMVAAGDGVARAHARLLADHSLQLHFAPMILPPPPPAWLLGLLKTLQAAGRFLHALGPVGQVLFWVVVGVAVLALVVVLARIGVRAWRRGRSRGPEAIKPRVTPLNLQPTPQRAAALIEEADRLAGEQRFEEAAHVLLFRTIDDLRVRRPRALRPALTSRDIAALADLPPPARQAFGTIAERVEHSFFGGRSLGSGDFSICRTAYLAFASPRSWTGAGV